MERGWRQRGTEQDLRSGTRRETVLHPSRLEGWTGMQPGIEGEELSGSPPDGLRFSVWLHVYVKQEETVLVESMGTGGLKKVKFKL